LKKYEDPNWLEEEYLVKKRKVVDIAKECKVNRITINRWLKRFNIPSRKFNLETLKKISEAKKGKNIGEQNHNWKGDNVSYTNLYLEASNISGEYKRDINDFEYLCASCHKIKHIRGVIS
jgi:hypothetical protein